MCFVGTNHIRYGFMKFANFAGVTAESHQIALKFEAGLTESEV